MFYKASQDNYKQVLPGINRKTLVYGNNSLLSEFTMKKGSLLPRHSHASEQTGYLVKGKIKLTFGGKCVEASPGDSWAIMSNIEHHAEILEDSIAIEVFTPVREDYLPE